MPTSLDLTCPGVVLESPSVPVADLLTHLSGEWRAATRHPFLSGVRDGTVPPPAFDTWLKGGGQTNGPPNGVFMYRGKQIGVRDVRDGTSNTIAFGEWKIGDFNANKISMQDVAFPTSTPPTGVSRNTATMYLPNSTVTQAVIQQWGATCNASAKTTAPPATTTPAGSRPTRRSPSASPRSRPPGGSGGR